MDLTRNAILDNQHDFLAHLAAEMRILILEILLQDVCRPAGLASLHGHKSGGR
jgi:hypothetical protein